MMGYRKWKLSNGDQYQFEVARYRVARMINAYALGIDGPVALGCEAPVEGWDDIVEFADENGTLTATHYLVKCQNTSFKAEDLEKIFGELIKSAADILTAVNPYDGISVAPECRRFEIVLPTQEIGVGADLGIDQLKMLLENCGSSSAAMAVVANHGTNIDNGKQHGGAQRSWLTKFAEWVDDTTLRSQLLHRLHVRVWPRDTVNEWSRDLLASHLEDANQAQLLVDDAIRKNPPEGLLDAEDLLIKLEDATPKKALRRVKLARFGDDYFAQPYTRQATLTMSAASIVEGAWAEHGAVDLHVGYPPPDNVKHLRLACVRLLLHARQSPVFVTERDSWQKRISAEVAGTVGLVAEELALASAHYEEKAATMSLPPKSPWPPLEFAAALHAAMDECVWRRVREDGKAALAGADTIPFEEVAAGMKALNDFFDRILRGWWGAEMTVSGVARCGPAVASRVARIVAAVAVLRHVGYDVGAPDVPDSIAKLGPLPIRALAIDRVSEIADKLPTAVGLAGHARDLLAFSGVVLLVESSLEDIYDFALLQPLDESRGGIGIQGSTASAFLMDATSLIESTKHGDDGARSLIKNWCHRRASHFSSDLEAAIQLWRESDAA